MGDSIPRAARKKAPLLRAGLLLWPVGRGEGVGDGPGSLLKQRRRYQILQGAADTLKHRDLVRAGAARLYSTD